MILWTTYKERNRMDLIYTWAELKAVQDRIEEIENLTDAIARRRQNGEPWDVEREVCNALWDEYHELDDKVDQMRKQVIPEVGMPCTVIWCSDRSGAYVEKILSPKKIQVKCDGLYSCTKVFTYRRNGHWVQQGTTSRDWGTLLALGYKSDYYDMEF